MMPPANKNWLLIYEWVCIGKTSPEKNPAMPSISLIPEGFMR